LRYVFRSIPKTVWEKIKRSSRREIDKAKLYYMEERFPGARKKGEEGEMCEMENMKKGGS
jgi:hypothetical protein